MRDNLGTENNEGILVRKWVKPYITNKQYEKEISVLKSTPRKHKLSLFKAQKQTIYRVRSHYISFW